MNAVHDKRHIDEVHGHIRLKGRQIGGRLATIEIGMPPAPACHARVPRDRQRQAGSEQVIVHGVKARSARRSARAERRQQFPASRFVEGRQIHRAIAFVAQYFDESWAAFFRRRLHLGFHHAKQVHLQGLDQKVLGVSAVRTRQ